MEREVLEGLERRDEGEGVSPCRFHRGHIQGDGERGDAQLEALFVGINPEVVTPHGGVGTASCVLHHNLSVELWWGGTRLPSGRQQGRDPTVVNL